MMDAATQALITAFPLGFTATVCADGTPAVAPKGTFVVVDDDTLGFADIRSPGTMKNLAHQAMCEVNFIDILKRTGVRVKGATTTHPRGSDSFDTLLPRWAAIWPDLAPRIRAIVLVKAEKVSHYRTPPYDDGATEEEMVALYKAKFAEMYS
ncbi:MAG: pyridoxamine 5'-phosphate oxidase family protein [Pseudomonadota bacterium]